MANRSRSRGPRRAGVTLVTVMHMRSPVAGDAVPIGDTRWTVADPTERGADAGQAMPQLKTVQPTIIRIRP